MNSDNGCSVKLLHKCMCVWRYLLSHHPFEALEIRSPSKVIGLLSISGQIALNRWSDRAQSVVRLPSIDYQIAFNRWSDRPQLSIRSSSIGDQIAFNRWSDCIQSVIRSPSIRAIGDQIVLNWWSDCPQISLNQNLDPLCIPSLTALVCLWSTSNTKMKMGLSTWPTAGRTAWGDLPAQLWQTLLSLCMRIQTLILPLFYHVPLYSV